MQHIYNASYFLVRSNCRICRKSRHLKNVRYQLIRIQSDQLHWILALLVDGFSIIHYKSEWTNGLLWDMQPILSMDFISHLSESIVSILPFKFPKVF